MFIKWVPILPGANKAASFPHHVAVHKTQPEPETEVTGQTTEGAVQGHGHHHHHGHKPMALLDRYSTPHDDVIK